jgi:hypothetical protein
LHAPRVDERLQRLNEEGETQRTFERLPQRSAFWERWCEFAAVTSRLNQLEGDAKPGNGEGSTDEINELWDKRAELATKLVDAEVTTVEEAIFKATVGLSLLSEGEILVVLTPQCLEDCDRALAIDRGGAQCVETLEPDLWAACFQVRERLAEADEAEALSSTWCQDLQNQVSKVSGYEAVTRAGLNAKGQIFRDLFDFANLMDGLSALQMSYVRDFNKLAHRCLRDEDSLRRI